MLNVPTWCKLSFDTVTISSRMCILEPGKADITSLTLPVGAYNVWLGYQFLLGTRVGKLLLVQGGDTSHVHEALVGMREVSGTQLTSGNGMVCVGDFDALKKLHDEDALLDKCRASVSTNEMAGVFDGVAVASTMCMKPNYSVRAVDRDGRPFLYVDFAEGL